MSKQYFGTDGIRGEVGQAPITPDFMLKLGWVCGRVFSREAGENQSCTVIIGKDTRVSGYMFESALEAGLVAAGANVRLLGPMPTPAVALMTRTLSAQVGIVISASHNPYYDNGIKLFNGEGRKLDDQLELAIEAELAQELVTVESAAIGKALRVVDAAGRYIEFCKSTVPDKFSLRGLKLVVDCAHGATYHIAPSVFAELGAEVIAMGVEPDGFNINREVGSTHTAALSARVIAEGADLGVALDGDGDRVIFVDANGNVVDGDELLLIIALHQKPNGVAGTLMTNLGVELALRDAGIAFGRANVGDRYVNEMMRENNWVLGGESSGHIICSELATTGDGIVAALQVLVALQASGRSLDSLRQQMRKFPQQMINVRLTGELALAANSDVKVAVAAAEAELGENGRVLLRPSGTEPVVRVVVEGEDTEQVGQLCTRLAEQVEAALA